MQSKLLKYLCEETIVGRSKPSQFSVAVDGLGRPEDYDLNSDSYPRVQISRLRRSLANVYSRIDPLNNLCVFIRKGEYRLHLAPRATAYPEQRARRSDFRPAEHHDLPTDQGDTPWSGAAGVQNHTRNGAPPELIGSSDGASHLPDKARPPVPDQPGLFRTRALVAIALLLAIIAAIALGRNMFTGNRGEAMQQVPLVHFAIRASNPVSPSSPMGNLEDAVRENVTNRISASFIAGLAPPDLLPRDAEYNLGLNLLGTAQSPQTLDLILTDNRNTTLYRASIPYDGQREDLLDGLGSALDDMLTPYGIIAQHELDISSGKPQTDYGCFITIEVMRSRGKPAGSQIDQCIKRFPNSEFKPYWLSRKSYELYQAGIAKGIPLDKNTEAQALYHEAFTLAPNNAFANTLAAKISIAKGDCTSAAIFSQRALKSGEGYPTLRILIGADMTSCPIPPARRKAFITQLRNVALRSNQLNGQLALLMNLAALGTGDSDLIALVQSETAHVPVEGTASPVLKAIGNPAYFDTHQAEIRKAVDILIWNPNSREKIMQGLSVSERNKSA
ncbi:MAG: hypothetical protein ABGW87_01775 [Sphingomonadaceae bacterium]